MTLEEAIKHCEEVAKSCQLKAYDIERDDYKDLEECAVEHRQLAEWLTELKAVQDIIKQHDSDSMPEDYWYIDKIRGVLE